MAKKEGGGGGKGKEEKEVVVTYDEQAFNPERTNSHGR